MESVHQDALPRFHPSNASITQISSGSAYPPITVACGLASALRFVQMQDAQLAAEGSSLVAHTARFIAVSFLADDAIVALDASSQVCPLDLWGGTVQRHLRESLADE